MIQSLEVMLWGRQVGTLVHTRVGYSNRIYFYFDKDFVKSGLDIAPLRASIYNVPAQNGMPIYPEEERIYGGLPSFIADSLPDHWGEVVFAEWAKAKGISRKELTALDRLAYIGRRGMGALEFVPPVDEKLESPFKVEIDALSELAQRALAEAKGFRATFSPGFAIESLFKVGTSAGGRRPKAVINLNPDSMQCYSGQVKSPVDGCIPMIIKFDEHTDVPTTRIEYSYYLMALEAELRMMHSQLLESEGEVHFLTQRFDRKGDTKLHVQTLAALRPGADSYEDLMETAIRLGATPQSLEMLFRQMVLNVLAGNVDDHNKNFSFVMDEDGKWGIAPAYDFTFTVDPSAPWYINRHSLTINGKNQDITREDILAVADRIGIKEASGMIEEIAAIVGSYRRFAVEAGVPEIWISRIEAEIAARTSNL